MAVVGQIELLKRVSRTLCIAVGLLLVIGVLFVRSACFIWASQPGMLWLRQCAWIVLGTVGAVAAVLIDYRRVCREAWWIYGVCVFLLVECVPGLRNRSSHYSSYFSCRQQAPIDRERVRLLSVCPRAKSVVPLQ